MEQHFLAVYKERNVIRRAVINFENKLIVASQSITSIERIEVVQVLFTRASFRLVGAGVRPPKGFKRKLRLLHTVPLFLAPLLLSCAPMRPVDLQGSVRPLQEACESLCDSLLLPSLAAT